MFICVFLVVLDFVHTVLQCFCFFGNVNTTVSQVSHLHPVAFVDVVGFWLGKQNLTCLRMFLFSKKKKPSEDSIKRLENQLCLVSFFFFCLWTNKPTVTVHCFKILTQRLVLCRAKKQVLMIFWTFLPVSLQRWITESLNIIYILVKFSSKTEDESLLDIWASIHITAVLTQFLSAGSLQCLLHL